MPDFVIIELEPPSWREQQAGEWNKLRMAAERTERFLDLWGFCMRERIPYKVIHPPESALVFWAPPCCSCHCHSF